MYALQAKDGRYATADMSRRDCPYYLTKNVRLAYVWHSQEQAEKATAFAANIGEPLQVVEIKA
jgi:hypothetical protein